MLAASIGISALLVAAAPAVSAKRSEQLSRDTLAQVERAVARPAPERAGALGVVVAGVVDFSAFSARVMHDLELSSAERAQLTSALAALLAARAERLARDSDGAVCDEARFEGPRVECRRRHGTKTRTYRIELDITGDPPRIVDVTFGDALLSRNYRAMVNKLFRTRGFDGLLARLEEKTAAEITASAKHRR